MWSTSWNMYRFHSFLIVTAAVAFLIAPCPSVSEITSICKAGHQSVSGPPAITVPNVGKSTDADCDMSYLHALQKQVANLRKDLSEREKVLLLLGCGTAEGKTFFTGGKTLTFYDAKTECEKAGGQLATPKSDTQNKALENIVKQYSINAWIGVMQWKKGSQFVYLNHQRVAYTNWNSGEPNNEYNIEECVEMYTEGTWNDKSCKEKRLTICEF